jgi:hypothetical protein
MPEPTDAYGEVSSYLCNCGRSFPSHLARAAHMGSCTVMAKYREAADLRRRIDRTLDYTDSLLRLPEVSSVLADVLRAVHESLCTPASRESGESRG